MRRKIIAAAITAYLFVIPAYAETYRLIHAVGNDESEVARDLSKAECETRKKDLKGVAEALGIHSERLGIGSVVCLPESFFDD